MLKTPLSRVERRKEKTRRVLIEVALGLFYEKGIYWTKIEDITEQADIGKGTFYQYFDTKEALLQALLREGLDRLLTRIAEAVQAVPPGPKTLSKAIEAQLDFYLDNPEYLLLFHQVRGLLQLTSGHVKGLREVYDGYLDRLGEILSQAVDQNEDPGAWARELAMAVSAYTSGLLTYHLLFDRTGDFKRRREEIQAQLERSIQAIL